MKPSSNSIEDHPQLNHNMHLVDDALMGVSSWQMAPHKLKH